MTIVAVPGAPNIQIGSGSFSSLATPTAASSGTLDAANEAAIFVGQVFWADGASHTVDTSGSSAIGWQSGGATFANAGTTVVVGIAPVDTGAGPPARAANAADVIAFDVAASFTGGGGGIAANVWNSSVPTSGTKTIGHSDFVAVAIQMTARGGADVVTVISQAGSTSSNLPTVTHFVGAAYAAQSSIPNVILTAADGTLGYIFFGEVFTTLNLRIWNSGSATKEYGQLFNLGFPVNIYGIYGWIDPDANFDVVLYSDPLGTPVAEKIYSFDANTAALASGRRFYAMFSSPYVLPASTNIAAVFKPDASSISAYYKTLNSAGHRVADVWGTSGYGISRASGAFADANSGLDHYYIGLLVGAFDSGGGGAGSLLRHPGMEGGLV